MTEYELLRKYGLLFPDENDLFNVANQNDVVTIEELDDDSK